MAVLERGYIDSDSDSDSDTDHIPATARRFPNGRLEQTL